MQMRETVRAVARLFPTAIISGRGREKVESFVCLKELYYAGSHGMDIIGPRVWPLHCFDIERLSHGTFNVDHANFQAYDLVLALYCNLSPLSKERRRSLTIGAGISFPGLCAALLQKGLWQYPLIGCKSAGRWR